MRKSEWVATCAHVGQVDKSGNEYIEHVARVANAVYIYGDDAISVAWLHDVIEDTHITLDYLRTGGFDTRVIDAVDAITRREDESYWDYIRRCRENDLARIVKIADLEDNMRPERSGFPGFESLCKRYRKALALLGEEGDWGDEP